MILVLRLPKVLFTICHSKQTQVYEEQQDRLDKSGEDKTRVEPKRNNSMDQTIQDKL